MSICMLIDPSNILKAFLEIRNTGGILNLSLFCYNDNLNYHLLFYCQLILPNDRINEFSSNTNFKDSRLKFEVSTNKIS